MKELMSIPQAKKLIAVLFLAGLVSSPALLHAQNKKPAPKASAPARAAAPAKPAASGSSAHSGSATASRPGATANHGSTGTTRPGGRSVTATRGGGEMTKSESGRPESFKASNGNTAKFDSAGHVKEVHAGNTTITHGPAGTRRIVAEGPNHTKYVSNGRGQGYVQRPYMYHGHAYENRTYYRNGIARNEIYRSYYYHGVYLNGYYPAVYYAPAFYGWAYNPWVQPVYYSWGWNASPWYGYYGPYFAPAPVYTTASLWLTDYLIAQSLQSAYAAGVQAGASGGVAEARPTGVRHGNPHLVMASYSFSSPAYEPSAMPDAGVAMTPEIKQAIANEVTLTLDEEKTQAAQPAADGAAAHGLDTLLADGKPHVFVASEPISVQSSAGQECALTAGDVLQMASAPAASADAGQLQVLASKTSDCQKSSTVTVPLENLQEMHNSLMANVDAGLGDLQKKAGQDGIPAAPAGSQATTAAPYAAAAPPPDPNGASELARVAQEGDQADQQVSSEASAGPVQPSGQTAGSAPGYAAAAPASTGPVTIALGQTPAQVIAGKGRPKQIVNLGSKQIYVYGDMKVYFTAGKVVDVQ
jgi:hypothetical protein